MRAPWLSDGYDQLWRTEHDARPIDADGTVVASHRRRRPPRRATAGCGSRADPSTSSTPTTGPVTPVPVEVAVERLDGIERAAAVGVGPLGCQQLVVVVESTGSRDDGLASTRTCPRECVAAIDHPVAAVLTVAALPVDIRHNTKIDRTAVARWAAAVLSGGATGEALVTSVMSPR